jgi:hypothetical protein
MFSLMIGLSATGIAASYGVKLALSKQRRQDVQRALGIPQPGANAAQSAQHRRAEREMAAIESRIRERSPHLSATQRRELAVNLVRARGLVPAGDRRAH